MSNKVNGSQREEGQRQHSCRAHTPEKGGLSSPPACAVGSACEGLILIARPGLPAGAGGGGGLR